MFILEFIITLFYHSVITEPSMSDTGKMSNDSWCHVTEDVITPNIQPTGCLDVVKLFEYDYFTHVSPIFEPDVIDSPLPELFVDSCEDTLPETTNTTRVVTVSTKKQARKKANKTSAQKYRARKKDEQKRMGQICEALEQTNRELKIKLKQSADKIKALEEQLQEFQNNGITIV